MKHLFSIFKIDLRVEVDIQSGKWTVEVSQYVCNAPNAPSAAALAKSQSMSDDFGGRVSAVEVLNVQAVDAMPKGACVAFWETDSLQIPLIAPAEKGVWVQ